MEASMPIVMRAMVGILPFFIGFALLGLCLFWESHRFSSASSSMFTLFALMNGDSITEVYHDISYWKFLLANFYCYFFVFISACVIQNVFIIIIEDGYLTIKYKESYDWL